MRRLVVPVSLAALVTPAAAAVVLTTAPPAAGAAAPAVAPVRSSSAAAGGVVSSYDGGYVLRTTTPGGHGYAPAFTGNGYLAGRIPAAGQGFAEVSLPGSSTPLPTQYEVQGFYAKISGPNTGLIERRAALPAWSTLRYDDGSGDYGLASGRVASYRQSLDMATGTVSTQVTWVSPAGRAVRLRYDVTPDRAREHAALVRLQVTPEFSGRIRVTDVLDGVASEFTQRHARGHAGATQWIDVKTMGIGVQATVASTFTGPGALSPAAVSGPGSGQSVAQERTLAVTAGHRYTFLKAVGIAVSTDTGVTGSAHSRAITASSAESHLGYAAARRTSDAAWAALWRSGDVRVDGNLALRGQVRAALFALLASTRSDVPWAPSPGGLSSDGYNGHVFWDSETWMYPSLLATEPGIARELLQYRVNRLGAARENARMTGYRGARYPWESALSGLEETPSCCDTGKFEVHINADIALAFWQYWLATGDRTWLRTEAWPVVSGIADFWVSRATRNSDGSYSIDHVIPPDEYADGVNNSVYTNVAARDALRIAAQVAALTGHQANPVWARVAGGLRILFNSKLDMHPEYAGYPGDTVKQADVTLLSYPWQNPQPASVTLNDLNYYVPRTDPNGPSMTDAINSIVSSQLGVPGCSSYSFTERSVEPFMRGPYDQFSEARTGGAFTFTTGAGGFLQEFLYGYSGFRWRSDGVWLDPSLPPQLTGVVLSGLHWRGRTLRVDIRHSGTSVHLVSGAGVTLTTPAGSRSLAPGETVTIATRLPAASPTSDLARCRPVTTSRPTADPAVSANDGTATTTWLAELPGTSVTVDLGRVVRLGRVTISRPPVLAIASTTPGAIAVTGPTRSAAEVVEVSANGSSWQVVARVAHPGLNETFRLGSVPARFVRVRAGTDATAAHPLVVGDLGAYAAG